MLNTPFEINRGKFPLAHVPALPPAVGFTYIPSGSLMGSTAFGGNMVRSFAARSPTFAHLSGRGDNAFTRVGSPRAS